jgi:hypothetical protein
MYISYTRMSIRILFFLALAFVTQDAWWLVTAAVCSAYFALIVTGTVVNHTHGHAVAGMVALMTVVITSVVMEGQSAYVRLPAHFAPSLVYAMYERVAKAPA